ncbi:hypothetical protein C0J56_26690 [Pseudomonas fluorescens]|nr:hypothetical protein C0J56_26690 [Pseudomonas fluorescens]
MGQLCGWEGEDASTVRDLCITLKLILSLWRGDLSPLDCAAVPVIATWVGQIHLICLVGAAVQPSGDKSPLHKSATRLERRSNLMIDTLRMTVAH